MWLLSLKTMTTSWHQHLQQAATWRHCRWQHQGASPPEPLLWTVEVQQPWLHLWRQPLLLEGWLQPLLFYKERDPGVASRWADALKEYWNRAPIGSPFPVTESFLERVKRSLGLK